MLRSHTPLTEPYCGKSCCPAWDECVTYEIEYAHYSLTDSGIAAHFADGTRETGSLLIGADGVRSAVRRQYLPHLTVLDTKSRPLFGKTPLTPSFKGNRMLVHHQRHADWQCDADGGDPLLAKGPQEGQARAPERLRVLGYHTVCLESSSSRRQFDRLSKEAAAELSKALKAHWHPSLRPLVEDQDPIHTGVFRLLSSDSKSLMRS